LAVIGDALEPVVGDTLGILVEGLTVVGTRVVGLIVGSMTLLLGCDVVVTTGAAWAQSLNDFHDMVRQQASTVPYPASHAFLARPAQGANVSRQSATHMPPLRDQSTNHVAAMVGGDVGVFFGGTPIVTGDAVVVGFAVGDEDGLTVGLDIVG
jgi:hypothetical protein